MRQAERIMPGILGNSEVCGFFASDIESDSLTHAYILEGAFGTGKFTLAMNIAAAVSCLERTNDSADLPCGKCRNCEKILGGLTPDIIVVGCEDGKSSISKEQIKAVRDKVCFSPTEMAKKVVIIRDAHLMTQEAQNSLLLTLEEPPEYILFLLLTDNSLGLLETVRSRAPVIRVRALEDTVVRDYIIEHSNAAKKLSVDEPEEFSDIIISAAGSIGLAMKLTDPTAKDELLRLRELTDGLIGCLGKHEGFEESLGIFENSYFKSRDNTGKLLTSFQKAVRDLLLLRRADNVRLCYYTDTAKAAELACRFRVSYLISCIEATERARIDITVRNTNIKLTLLKLASEIFRNTGATRQGSR